MKMLLDTDIKEGFYVGHSFCITINPNVKIEKNVIIYKGVTIGHENRDIRKGSPVISNNVWIGINATIVGVKIGEDVRITSITYINCDIPDHSIDFGNPCMIKHNDNATDGYIKKYRYAMN